LDVWLVGGVEALDAMQGHASSVIESTLLCGTGFQGYWGVVWVSLGMGLMGVCVFNAMQFHAGGVFDAAL